MQCMSEIRVGDEVYELCRDPNGNPPGQIKAYKISTKLARSNRVRAYLPDLPPQVQNTFAELVGMPLETLLAGRGSAEGPW